MNTGSIGTGVKFGKPSNKAQDRQARSQAMTQAFNKMDQKTQIIRQQANEIIQSEKARQDYQRANLFHLFDVVG